MTPKATLRPASHDAWESIVVLLARDEQDAR